jgi:hypothetical protein
VVLAVLTDYNANVTSIRIKYILVIMAKETEREEIKEETHELEDEEKEELEDEENEDVDEEA